MSDSLFVMLVILLSFCGYFADPLKSLNKSSVLLKEKADKRAKLIEEMNEKQ